MINKLNIVNVSLEDISSVIRNILAEELKKAESYFKLDIYKFDVIEEYLTREEVCKMLKVSTTTLYNWNNDKILVNHKLGRRVYYMKADVLSKLSHLKNVA